MTVEIFPSTDVQEGQNITICCRSVSFPPPAVILSKMDSETNIYSYDGVFLLINLTPNDTGLYQINVTNSLGYETEIFNINVMGEWNLSDVISSYLMSEYSDNIKYSICEYVNK